MKLSEFLPTRLSLFAVAIALILPQATHVRATEIDDAITAIKNVGSKGNGHDDAIAAMKILNRCSVDQVPKLLKAMDDANPLGQNWLRGAISGAVSRGGTLPASEIRAYFDQRDGSPLGRLLAFELLSANDKSLAETLVPKLFDDPSLPLRRKAIKWYLDTSEDAEAIRKIGMLGFALNHARDVDQVRQIKAAMSKNGVEIDLTRQLGYASQWKLTGPFNNVEQKGFDVAYGPEKTLDKIDVHTAYADGKPSDGKPTEVKWQTHATVDEMGVVDLNSVMGRIKGATVYAYTEFDTDEDRDVEIRIGSINAHKVWVNGQLVISNEIYHVGMMPDQFSGKAKLQKGSNRILFKVCQNEMTQAWAQDWKFQLRICDATGKAISPASAAARGDRH